MIRLFFWLILLVNLLLFASMYWGGSLTGENASLQAQPPLNPDKIKLLPAVAQSAVPVASAATPVPVPAPASAPAATAAPQPVPQPHSAPLPATPQPVAPKPAAPQSMVQQPAACLEWGEFSGTDLARANSNLADLKLGDRLTRRIVEQDKGYWVYIPPLKTRAKVNQKIAQLKKLGVGELFIVQEGKWKRAISMGVFKSQEAAHKYLGSLKAKGVKGASVGERQAKLKLTVFRLKDPDAATRAKLAAWQKEFPGYVLKGMSCN